MPINKLLIAKAIKKPRMKNITAVAGKNINQPDLLISWSLLIDTEIEGMNTIKENKKFKNKDKKISIIDNIKPDMSVKTNQ